MRSPGDSGETGDMISDNNNSNSESFNKLYSFVKSAEVGIRFEVLDLNGVKSQVYVKYIDCFTMALNALHPIRFES